MRRLAPSAIVGAALSSSIAIYDAVHHGLTGQQSVFSEEAGSRWSVALAGIAHSLTYLLVVAVLMTSADRIDGGSIARRWVRRALAATLSVLAGVMAVGSVISRPPGALALLAGAGFLAMFLFGPALGALLVRRAAWRGRAGLLLAPIPLLGAAIVLAALGSDWAHPGYAETALYVGLALLGREHAGEADRGSSKRAKPTWDAADAPAEAEQGGRGTS